MLKQQSVGWVVMAIAIGIWTALVASIDIDGGYFAAVVAAIPIAVLTTVLLVIAAHVRLTPDEKS